MDRQLPYVGITLAAAAAWSITVGAHELLGHGGACLAVEGCHGRYADAMYFDFAYEGSSSGRAWILIGGPAVSFVVGLIGLAWRVLSVRPRPAVDWLAWALIPAGWISGGAYVAFGQFIHPGMDTAQLARMGGDAASTLITILGVFSISLGVVASALLMPVRVSGRRRVLVVAATILGFTISAFGAGFLVPGDRIFLLMGAFGASVLFTLVFWLAALPWPTWAPKPLTPGPGLGMCLVLLALTGGYVFWLGPGINF